MSVVPTFSSFFFLFLLFIPKVSIISFSFCWICLSVIGCSTTAFSMIKPAKALSTVGGKTEFPAKGASSHVLIPEEKDATNN